MVRLLFSRALLVAFAITSLQFESTKADWPAFLGGKSRSAVNDFTPPLKWNPEEGIGWQTTLPGHGQSSPVIMGDCIYLTAVEGPMKTVR